VQGLWNLQKWMTSSFMEIKSSVLANRGPESVICPPEMLQHVQGMLSVWPLGYKVRLGECSKQPVGARFDRSTVS